MTTKIKSIETVPYIDPYHRDTMQLTKTFITFDGEDSQVWVSQEMDDNATPEWIWNGRGKMFRIINYLDGGQSEAFLNNLETQKELDKIFSEYKTVWNGNNLVGSWGEKSQELMEEIVSDLEDCYTHVEYWTCEDWFGNCSDEELGLQENMSDQELEALAENLSDDFLVDDVLDYLKNRID